MLGIKKEGSKNAYIEHSSFYFPLYWFIIIKNDSNDKSLKLKYESERSTK